jgi:predicted transcriptional regulator
MAKVRTTITIDEGLWHRFQRVAELEDRSFSATVNGWLEQVVEPAEFVASQIDADKQASAQRLRTLMGAVQAVNDQAGAVLARAKGSAAAGPGTDAKRRAGAGRVVNPPPCNTGGKFKAVGAKPRGGNSHE